VRTICLIALTFVACGFLTPSADKGRPPDSTREPAVHWRASSALGTPSAGRLVRGVQLPASDPRYFTWDPLLHRRPDRPGRRWGTDFLVRKVLGVVAGFSATHPSASRVGIGDLSRRHGGPFGPRHASHQNGLDVDVYYPRSDRRERPPRVAAQIDHGLAQDLVDRFVAAGASVVFVGPNTGLTGPAGVVEVLWNHDNHLHARFENPDPA
jgi:murein endopeptidase